MVNEHESRLDRNLLVSLELCKIAGRLARLRHLALKGPSLLHLHDLALLALSPCTALESLEIDVPNSW